MKKKIQKWNLALSALGGILGAFIGMTIIYLTTGKFDLSLLLGVLTGASMIIIINIVKIRMKKDKLPESDERIQQNMRNYLLYASHIFIAGLFLALAIFTFLGFESISLTYLWIPMIAYLCLIGFGGLLLSRR